MDMHAAYREVGSYRATAEICGTTPKTVKRSVEAARAAEAGPVPGEIRHNYDGVADVVAETVARTKGRITVDLLSDFVHISDETDAKLKRTIGAAIIDAGRTLLRAAPDRAGYGLARLQSQSPHLRIIQALGKSLQGQGEEPTPFAEVDYVIRLGDKICKEIDRQVGRTVS